MSNRYMDDRTYEALRALERVNSNAFYSVDSRIREQYRNEDCSRRGMHIERRNNHNDPCRQFDEEWDVWTY